MKCFIKIITALTLAAGTQVAVAQDCEIPVAVVLMQQSEEVPEAAAEVLTNSLTRIAVSGGMNADLQFTQFVLTARVDVLDKSVHAGPPMQVVYNLGVTFYIADVYNKKKFSTAYVEIDGVGQNETKAFINAFRSIKASRKDIADMLAKGKKTIMSYYDTQYPNILKEARRKASLQQYEEAIALTVAIPACSRGGDEAIKEGLKIYTKYRDRYCLAILNKARGIWAASQNQEAAQEVAELLQQIDPEAACYDDALALMREIKSQVRSDIDFEMREKYRDGVELEQQRIAAIRAIGVAYGQGQKPTTTNIMWLR